MKVIALSCSPSRGRNSDRMLDYFIQGMRQVSGIEVEKIYLQDIPIDYYSHQNSKGTEPHEVLFKGLVEKITREEIGLVIATPTYNFSVPAHLKNFIDRLRFVALDFTKKNRLGQPLGKLGNIRTYFLVSGGTPAWAEKVLFFAYPSFWLRGVFLYFGAKVMGAYYTGDINAHTNSHVLNVCMKKGKRYAYKLMKHYDQHITEHIFWRPPQDEK